MKHISRYFGCNLAKCMAFCMLSIVFALAMGTIGWAMPQLVQAWQGQDPFYSVKSYEGIYNCHTFEALNEVQIGQRVCVREDYCLFRIPTEEITFERLVELTPTRGEIRRRGTGEIVIIRGVNSRLLDSRHVETFGQPGCFQAAWSFVASGPPGIHWYAYQGTQWPNEISQHFLKGQEISYGPIYYEVVE